MFGDYDFYGKPYAFQKNRMEIWLKQNNNKRLVIMEIGCGINPHSLRMEKGKMMSGEWKMPKITNLIKTIRINPNDYLERTDDTIHISKDALSGIKILFS